ncbi:MAG TPA: DUF4424 domain-containing protein [Allosphingosinicella sp.]|jgi:hypothetical protein
MRRFVIAAVAAGLAASPAPANDSTAETAAGGLVLKQSAEIDMVSEDLFLSPDQVRVRYVFRNRSAKDVRTLVAFPMPDRDLSVEWQSDVAFPGNFQTRVDGRSVPMRVERKAILGPADHSALLGQLKVPLGGDNGASGYAAIQDALDRLSAAQQTRLVRMGLAEREDEADGRSRLMPKWTIRETWFWEQTFPAGRDLVVEHDYVPGTGGSVGTPLAMRDFRRSGEGRQEIRRYCADTAFLAGIDRLARQARGGEYPTLPDLRLSYILRTGANWRSPIGTFRLVVDKGAPENLVSFCGEGIRKISPTRFEMKKSNWRPDRDLHILIVQPMPRDAG